MRATRSSSACLSRSSCTCTSSSSPPSRCEHHAYPASTPPTDPRRLASPPPLTLAAPLLSPHVRTSYVYICDGYPHNGYPHDASTCTTAILTMAGCSCSASPCPRACAPSPATHTAPSAARPSTLRTTSPPSSPQPWLGLELANPNSNPKPDPNPNQVAALLANQTGYAANAPYLGVGPPLSEPRSGGGSAHDSLTLTLT